MTDRARDYLGRLNEFGSASFGGVGAGPDTSLPSMWATARTMRIADGPDEVHLRSIAKAELPRSDRTAWLSAVTGKVSSARYRVLW